MTLEEKIDKACRISARRNNITSYFHNASFPAERVSVCSWKWQKWDTEDTEVYCYCDVYFKMFKITEKFSRELLKQSGLRTIADYFIKQASLVECLTSPSEYIREKKKRLEELNNV